MAHKWETCAHCVISHASGFGDMGMIGTPTCKLYWPQRSLPDDLRGTYEQCFDVQLNGKCKYKPLEENGTDS